jgi:hypothetical protein
MPLRRVSTFICRETARLGYFLGADGNLMPTRKGQAPPDLRYFKSLRK